MLKRKIKFQHYLNGEILEVVGTTAPYNNPGSEYLIIDCGGRFEAIMKWSILEDSVIYPDEENPA